MLYTLVMLVVLSLNLVGNRGLQNTVHHFSKPACSRVLMNCLRFGVRECEGRDHTGKLLQNIELAQFTLGEKMGKKAVDYQ